MAREIMEFNEIAGNVVRRVRTPGIKAAKLSPFWLQKKRRKTTKNVLHSTFGETITM
jgi:hypothetical protein